MKLLVSSILAAAGVSAQNGALTPAQQAIQNKSKFNNWYHDLTNREFINQNFALQYDELVVKVDVFTGYKNEDCTGDNGVVNAGCQFIKILKREMEVLAPHTRYDQSLNDINNRDRDLYCNAEDGLCLGVLGGSKATKIFPSFAGNQENYAESVSLNQIENPKGWNCIFPQAGPVSCLFFGDFDNCRKLHNVLNAKPDLNTQECDQAIAKEYCWRHGAELALPDFLTMNSVIRPLCTGDDKTDDSNYVMSIEKYWLDAKKVVFRNDANANVNVQANLIGKYSSGEHFNVITNSKYSLLGKLDHRNRFIGIQTDLELTWAKSDKYSGNLYSKFGRFSDYELLIRSYSADDFFALNNNISAINNIWDTAADLTNSNRKNSFLDFTLQEDEYFSKLVAEKNSGDDRKVLERAFDTVFQSTVKLSQSFLADDNSKDLLGEFRSSSFSKKLFGGQSSRIEEYKTSRKSSNSTDTQFHGALMINSARTTLGKMDTSETFMWNKNCMIVECEDSGAIEYKVVSCNQLGVRPLCVMDSFINVEAICPSEIGVNFCGDSVRPFLMTTVYGNLAQQYKYNNNGVLSQDKSSFKLGQNGLTAISSISGTNLDSVKNNDDNIIAALNRYLVQKNVLNGDSQNVYQRALYMQCDTINADVDGPSAIDQNGRYKPDRIKSYNRKVCEQAGWSYDPANNRFNYQFPTTGMYASKFNSNTPCKCVCPSTALTWENVVGHKSYTRTQVTNAAAYVHTNAQDISAATQKLRDRASTAVNVSPTTIDNVVAKYNNLKSEASVNQLVADNADDIQFHCCAPGYRFESTDGFNYGNIAISRGSGQNLINRNDQSSVQIDCGISYCKELSTSVNGLFWTSNVQNVPTRVRVDLNGKVHNTIDKVYGKCVPLQCLRPVCDLSIEKYDKQFDSVSELYNLGQTYTSCRCPCDSTFSTQTCQEYSTFVGKILYEPPKFRKLTACSGANCVAPLLERNQKFEDPIDSNRRYTSGQAIIGNQIRVRCDSGFQLACRDNNDPDCDVRTGLITCKRNSESCVQPMLNPYTCTQIFCTNPCDRDEFDIEVDKNSTRWDSSKTQWAVNEQVDCKCKDGLVQQPGSCISTCRINGQGLGTFTHQCSCGNDNCKLTCEVPNANLYTNSRGSMRNIKYSKTIQFQRSEYLTPSKQKSPVIPLYDHVFMQCKPGFKLRYSHNDELVGADQQDKCARQCYKDPHSEPTPYVAKLDPIACYCAPDQCPGYVAPVTHEDNDYQKKNFSVYWPDTTFLRNKFSEVCSKCKGDSFSTTFGHKHDCVKCTSGTINQLNQLYWTKEGKCIEEVCPDPRGVYGAQLTATDKSASHSLNLRHTVSSMDLFQIPQAKTSDGSFIRKGYSSMTFGDYELPVGVQPTNRLKFSLIDQFTTNGDAYFPFYKEDGVSGSIRTAKIDAVEGTRATFTCMKGFSPYLNWPEAVEAGNFGPLNGRGFDCVCKHGKWCCKAHCRCDGICAKPKCVGC